MNTFIEEEAAPPTAVRLQSGHRLCRARQTCLSLMHAHDKLTVLKLTVLQRSLIEAPEEGEAAPATAARLQILRLTREEMGFKTVPLLPSLDSADAADLQARHLIRT